MTIEERYGNPQEPFCFETDREEQWYQCGQVNGATEQQKIDVKVAARCVCENCYKDCEFVQCTDEECMLQCPILIDLYNKMKI